MFVSFPECLFQKQSLGANPTAGCEATSTALFRMFALRVHKRHFFLSFSEKVIKTKSLKHSLRSSVVTCWHGFVEDLRTTKSWISSFQHAAKSDERKVKNGSHNIKSASVGVKMNTRRLKWKKTNSCFCKGSQKQKQQEHRNTDTGIATQEQ